MAEVVREVERKYVAPGGVGVPDFAGMSGGVRVEAGKTVELDAMYFDTPGLALAARGITLRRRTGGADAGWHLKLPAGVDARDEVRVPLGASEREVPAELAVRIRAYTRDGEPVPTVRLRTVREVRLVRAGGPTLAEIAHDAVTAEVFAGSGVTTMSWTEVEVELVEGEPGLLDVLDRRLVKGGWRRAETASKLGHALAEAGRRAERRVAKPRAGSAGALALDYVLEQVDTLLAYDPRVRLDEPDAVHKMRVATRRLRSAFRVFSKVLDERVTGILGAELKWLAAELGRVRDQEVLVERLRERIAALPAEAVLGPVEARLTAWDARRTAEARTRVLSELDGARYFALLDALDTLVARPPFTARAGQPARRPAAAALRRSDRRISRRARVALRSPAGRARDTALHEVRKAAKRVRYAGEATRPALGKPAKQLTTRAKEMQELLGTHQDSVQTRKALRRLAIAAHAAGESAFTWGLLYGEEVVFAQRVETEFPSHWHDFARPRLRRGL
ncbi:CYTH and CHAD domain-containing protein [Embleya scabrispora]|uniref:CYTH and CHAD domain-containing protein n=1 Tax=Embleya scabrispora TaxID=159449 RepID=UPI00037E1FF2|nr:CYTH and CHAD domain-containing protein [Embleya scabrispora]MYS78754.1 CHAD domain-containing protein [Streptomyces sp. SID5474]